MVEGRIEKAELIKLITLKEEEIERGETEAGKAEKIFKVVEDVHRYKHFKKAQNLGIVFGPRDLTFTEMLLFSHIKDAMNE